jgi:hypothetical protein
MNAARLRELAQYVNAGPWRVARSDYDGALMLYAGDDPLATIYGGHDLALYLAQCAPALLLDDDETTTS